MRGSARCLNTAGFNQKPFPANSNCHVVGMTRNTTLRSGTGTAGFWLTKSSISGEITNGHIGCDAISDTKDPKARYATAVSSGYIALLVGPYPVIPSIPACLAIDLNMPVKLTLIILLFTFFRFTSTSSPTPSSSLNILKVAVPFGENSSLT